MECWFFFIRKEEIFHSIGAVLFYLRTFCPEFNRRIYIMKIKNVIIATFSVALLASCGGADMCSCTQTQLDMMKEMKDAKGDEAKLKDIEESYKADKEACDKMGDEMMKEMEGMSDEEQEAKGKEIKEEMESCDAYKEMEKMMEEEMSNM